MGASVVEPPLEPLLVPAWVLLLEVVVRDDVPLLEPEVLPASTPLEVVVEPVVPPVPVGPASGVATPERPGLSLQPKVSRTVPSARERRRAMFEILRPGPRAGQGPGYLLGRPL
jgi:hypothetical protein